MKFYNRYIKIFSTITIVLLVSFQVYGNQIRIDSLEVALKNTTNKEQQFDLLLKLAENYKHIDPSKTMSYANLALELAASDHIKKGKALTYIARAYFISGNPRKALDIHYKALISYRKSGDSLSVANTYVNIGEDFRRLSEPGNAINYYLKALTLYSLLNNYENLASVYTNIGIIYRTTGEYDKAISHYEKALQYAQLSKDTLFISITYNNIGNVYADLNQYEESLTFHKKALELRKIINKPYYITGSLLNIGSLYEKTGKLQASIEYLEEAAEIAAGMNDNYTLSLALYNLGFVYHKTGNSDKGIDNLIKAIDIAKSDGNFDILIEANNYLSKIYSDLNLYKEALEFKNLEYYYRDSLNKKEKEQNLAELKTRYEVAQKEKEITILQKEKEISSIQRNLLLAGLAGFIMIFYLLFLNFKTRIRKNKELLQKQKELHQKEQLLQKAMLEKQKLNEIQLESELELKSRQLTSHTLNIIQKNKLFEELQHKLVDLKNANGNFGEKLHQLNKYINYSLRIEEDWEEFRIYFEQINQDFYKKLKDQVPDLSPSELRLAALIKLNMSIKEAASVLNISPGSVKTARYRLRKKLSLKVDNDLNDFINSI